MKLRLTLATDKRTKFSPEENKFKHVALIYSDRILLSPGLMLKIKPGAMNDHILSAEDLDSPGTFYIQFTSDSISGYRLRDDDKETGYKMFKSLKKNFEKIYPAPGIYELDTPMMYENKMWYKLIKQK